MLALAVALLSAGALYAVFAPQAQTAHAQEDPALVRQGEQLYNNACISCHGMNLQGVELRGPSLIGVGEAAVYFQVSTGRMPATRQEAQIGKKPVRFTPQEIDALGAFVQANGGGPVVPTGSLRRRRPGSRRRSLPAQLRLMPQLHRTRYRTVLRASTLPPSTEVNRPADLQRDDQRTAEHAQVLRRAADSAGEAGHHRLRAVGMEQGNNPGGYSLGGFGPVPEGLISWMVGISALVGVTLWIGSKA